MIQLQKEFTVIVRIGLYVLTGLLARGGWLPPDLVRLFRSPEVVELAAVTILGLVAFLWYWFSEVRKALKER